MLVTQSSPTLCDPMDCSPPGSSVLEPYQAGMLEWVAIPFSRGSSQPRAWTQVSCIAGRFFTVWAPGKPIGFQGALLFWKPLKMFCFWLFIDSPEYQFKNRYKWNLPGGPVVKTTCSHSRGLGCTSLVGELRSCMPKSAGVWKKERIEKERGNEAKLCWLYC